MSFKEHIYYPGNDNVVMGKRLSERKLKEIQCPICKKIFIVKKPRSLKQWRVSLVIHLTAGTRHRLPLDKAIEIVDDYIEKLIGKS